MSIRDLSGTSTPGKRTSTPWRQAAPHPAKASPGSSTTHYKQAAPSAAMVVDLPSFNLDEAGRLQHITDHPSRLDATAVRLLADQLAEQRHLDDRLPPQMYAVGRRSPPGHPPDGRTHAAATDDGLHEVAAGGPSSSARLSRGGTQRRARHPATGRAPPTRLTPSTTGRSPHKPSTFGAGWNGSGATRAASSATSWPPTTPGPARCNSRGCRAGRPRVRPAR